MSYAGAIYPGIGYDVEIDTPLGRQTVSFDLDKVSKDVAAAIMTEAWPLAEARARATMPTFIDEGISLGVPRVKQALKDEAQKAIPFILGTAALIAIGWWVAT